MAPATEQNLTFEWNGLSLGGTLHRPDAEGRAPVVLMLQGSGPADRDCGDYFPSIRRTFLARGMAAFAFDKPGCGVSTGSWYDYDLAGRADQARAALTMLRRHPAIDPGSLGVWGQSQGGWLAQLLADGRSGISCAIANSGPSIAVPEQNLYGCEHTMRAEGCSEAAIQQALAFLAEVHEAARRDLDYRTLDSQILQRLRGQHWYGSYLTIEDPRDWHLMKLLVREGNDPLEAIGRIRCSFLAVYGGLDVLVPAWLCAEESGRALQRAAVPDAAVVVFPNGDHRIQDPTTGEFVPGYLDHVGQWMAERLRRERPTDRS
ncbi:MAG: alpha/beta hydrolase family protein [Acidimicrobiales bacterium]